MLTSKDCSVLRETECILGSHQASALLRSANTCFSQSTRVPHIDKNKHWSVAYSIGPLDIAGSGNTSAATDSHTETAVGCGEADINETVNTVFPGDLFVIHVQVYSRL